VTPRALETIEIPGIVDDFRQAAENAKQAGFDGVEVHAANGYLLDQFLRDGSNHRTDAYGGPVENRARLLLDVIDAVTTVWSADQVGVRLSPINSFNDIADSDPDATFGYVARQLKGYGLAYLHVVETDMTGAASAQTFDRRKLRNAFRGTYIANGGYDKARAKEAIANGDADFVAFGIPFIANPDLVERFALNAPLTEPDQATFYGGDERGYIDYPFLEEAAAAFAA
jgi:N-ethylmaleimide reductase